MRNIIVIGASAGGINAVKKVLKRISADIDAAIVVVVHLSRKSNSEVIAYGFQKQTGLKCLVAQDDMPLEKRHIYLAQADHHLMVKDEVLKVNQGPHENKYRPSVDVLFRSAAVAFGNRAIGIVLTGLLEDGTSGMFAIKKCGGVCIVQDPAEAEFSDMPRSVMHAVEVDYISRLDDIGDVLNELLNKPLPPYKIVPVDIKIEADITEKMMSEINDLKLIADRSDFICPDCGGGLWEIKNDPVKRYRCHTGHVYTQKLLDDLQDQKIEESIWVAIRLLEEKVNLMKLMGSKNENSGELTFSQQQRVDQINKHITRLKLFMSRLNEEFLKTKPDI